MRISELAKKVDMSPDTLRYYEQQGLLKPPNRTAAGYRDYTHAHLAQLNFIRRAKDVGFSLQEISELLKINFEKQQHSCHEVKQLTLRKKALVAERIAELQRFYASLSQLAEQCCGTELPAEHCSILTALEDVDGLTN
ncbi:Zn(2+)-responsive transcriptional regulator [Pseudoalteromonas sp. CO325X]|uniref:Zn(2+)-responsive transcriptional regulator n=1 Tax=Pseudoalteromonas sp. CO325X TaxID=1777262 RepID=UPI0010232752|nr:Zn(2+)-responsive transcriptional regulator [Pseudoalteromonas sp. CO325X]RZF77682.1 Zn(2+)-responsive transcriptional regulator [Pseudoalteromonas sp. CO325X]